MPCERRYDLQRSGGLRVQQLPRLVLLHNDGNALHRVRRHGGLRNVRFGILGRQLPWFRRHKLLRQRSMPLVVVPQRPLLRFDSGQLQQLQRHRYMQRMHHGLHSVWW